MHEDCGNNIGDNGDDKKYGPLDEDITEDISGSVIMGVSNNGFTLDEDVGVKLCISVKIDIFGELGRQVFNALDSGELFITWFLRLTLVKQPCLTLCFAFKFSPMTSANSLLSIPKTCNYQ